MEPSSRDLPFVLVYGPWIWKLGLVLLLAAVFAIAIAWRRFAARRAMRRVLDRVEQSDSDGVIRGTLGGGSAATLFVSAPYVEAQHASWRAGALWVETADGRVHLEGDIVVECGTSGEATRYARPDMPDAFRQRVDEIPLVDKGRWSVMHLVRVSTGDEVVVRGKLVRSAAQEEATFRDGPVALSLTATACDPLQLAACKPRPVLPMMSPFRAALLAGVTLFAGYKVAKGIGEDWRDKCWDNHRYDHVEGFVELDASDNCVRAAAMPGQQERTYSALFHALEAHPHRDERSLARLAYLAIEGDNCPAFLFTLDESGRMEDLLAFSRRCNFPRKEQDALLALGRYDEALSVPNANEAASLEVLIAGERWNEAARRVEETARYFEAQKSEDPQTAAYYAVAARRKRCLAQLFRFHGGDAAAAAQLQVLAFADPEHVCLPMILEVDPLQRKDTLSTMDLWNERYDVARIIEAQAFLDGIDRFSLPFARESPEQTLVQLDETVDSKAIQAMWLVRLGQAAPTASAEERALVMRWHAVASVLDGKIQEAAQLALEVGPLTRERDALLLPSVIALYSPSRDDRLDPWLESEPRRFDPFGRLFLRAGRGLSQFRFGHDPEYAAALVEAHHGNGAPLADIVAKELWWRMGDVLAVWPHVKQGRELLRTRLRWHARYGSWRSHSPFDLASTSALRRELFRLVGENVQAEYWDRVYQRVARIFDRKRMIAFLLAE